MDFLTKDLLNYLMKLEWWQALIFIIIILMFLFMTKNVKSLTTNFSGFIRRFKNKRSCADCTLLMINLVTDVIKQKREVTDNILDEQMSYVELKYEVMIMEFLTAYKSYQNDTREKNKIPDYVMENKEYIIFQESLTNAMRLVLKEVRRSFKENGFNTKTEKEFIEYCKQKTEELISIGKKYMMAVYPQENMIVSLKYLFDSINVESIREGVYDIFINAKEIINKSKEKIINLENNYRKSMDDLIK